MTESFDQLAARARDIKRGVVRGRYAPSPTGPLHMGNVRTALLAWLQARLAGGCLIMRMEDLDTPRVRKGSAQQLLHDLRWLGLDWDEGPEGPLGPYHQSKRLHLYEEALRRLDEKGLVFPCFCSRKDIAQAASAPHQGDGKNNLYPGICRNQDHAPFGTSLARDGRRAAWRFRVGPEEVSFVDRVTGPFKHHMTHDVGDFVLFRTDGVVAYQLAVVVDDILMGVTDVVRGADLLDSTPRQIALFKALGFEPPHFWHMPLVMGTDGRRLAKRDNAHSIAMLREQGRTPQSLIGEMAASLGFIQPGVELTARELLEQLDMDSFCKKLKVSL